MDLQEIFAAGLGLVVTLITWFFNEQSKRADDTYKQKDVRYQELIKTLRQFYVLTPAEADEVDTARERRMRNLSLVDEFLGQVALCWLYCSDDVIRKSYAFLWVVLKDEGRSTGAIEKAAGQLMVAIRRDLDRNTFAKMFHMWGKRPTRLNPDDFRDLRGELAPG